MSAFDTKEPTIRFCSADVSFDLSLLQNKYVIVGAPSESGLGQIAVEAIYHVLKGKAQIQRVGYLQSPLLTPIAGYVNEFDGEKVLIHPAEVFISDKEGIIFILFRSPCLPGTELVFAHEFVQFLATTISPRATVVLTGASREGWDLNPYEPHKISIISDHSKALIESHFPGMFSLYDGSNCVNIRLPTLPIPPSSSSETAGPSVLTEEFDRFMVATQFLRQPNHIFNTSDLTFPLGMSWTVALLYQLYFDHVVGSSPNSSLYAAEAKLRETFSVYGLFDNIGSPIISGLQWVADLLPALQLEPKTEDSSSSQKLQTQQMIQQSLPSLWREILSETL